MESNSTLPTGYTLRLTTPDNACVVIVNNGTVVGYEELWDRRCHVVQAGDGYFHPDQRAKQHLPLAIDGLRVFDREE